MKYVVTGEIADPITVDEAKTHLRIPPGQRSDDTYIKGLIGAAREAAEAWMGRAIGLQTVTEYFEAWPNDGIFYLSINHVREVLSVTYTDPDGVEVEMDTDDFYYDLIDFPASFKLKETESIPSINTYTFNPIAVEYTAGWDPTQASEKIPDLILQGIKEHVADMYVNRTPVNIARDGRIAIQIPAPIQRLYGAYRARV